MKNILTVVVLLILSRGAMAHEGHHEAPGAVSAPHGGMVQQTSRFVLELVSEAGGVRIYTLDHEMKAVATAGLKMEGLVTFPKKKKADSVQFTTDGEAFVAKVDAKGAHRYSLKVSVTHAGQSESSTFTVEPK